jgi:hypothetical protein
MNQQSITLFVSKFSDACHEVLNQLPMNIIEQHMKVMWIDKQEIRDALEDALITTVPSIIVQDELGNKVNYEGNNFKMYWRTFITTHKNDSIETNLLNKMHSNTLLFAEKIKQSINDITY